MTKRRTPPEAAPPPPSTIGELQPDPENRRTHNARNLALVVDALQQVGAARSIVIDEDNIVLAGNGVTTAAAQAGITKLRIIDAGGDELIAVRRSGLTPEQKRQLAMYDNRTGELAEWNVEMLAADLQNGVDFAPFFFDGELAALGVLGDPVTDPQQEYANMPEFQQAAQSAYHTMQVHFKDAAALEAFGHAIGLPVGKTVRYLWFPQQEREDFTKQAYQP